MCFKGSPSQVKVLRKEEVKLPDVCTQAPCLYSDKVAKFELIGYVLDVTSPALFPCLVIW